MFTMMGLDSKSIVRNILMELEDGEFLSDQIMKAYMDTFHPAGLTTLTDKDEILREFLEGIMWEHACNHGKLNNLAMPEKEQFLDTWRVKTFEKVHAIWHQQQMADQYSETEQEVAEMDVNSAYPEYPQVPILDLSDDAIKDFIEGEEN